MSNVNGGAGNFTYTNVGAVLKPSGTITGMFLRAPDGTYIAQVTHWNRRDLRRCQAPGLLRQAHQSERRDVEGRDLLGARQPLLATATR